MDALTPANCGPQTKDMQSRMWDMHFLDMLPTGSVGCAAPAALNAMVTGWGRQSSLGRATPLTSRPGHQPTVCAGDVSA